MEPFNPQDQPGDVFDALASRLLMSTGVVSLIVDGMFRGAATGRLPADVSVPDTARELFATVLDEHLGASHSEPEIAAAAAVIDAALDVICEHVYPIGTVAYECEGRRRIAGSVQDHLDRDHE
jgi:hypothetical protein